jgi:AraC-like DNA-binding protein
MTTTRGRGGDDGKPDTIKYQRRRSLPGVELRSAFDSRRCHRFYSTGLELLVPITWRGRVWHLRRTELLEPGAVLAAHPGDVYAIEEVLDAGGWSSLTIDPATLAALTGKAWDRVRLRPFARLSPALHARLLAAMYAIQSAPGEEARDRLCAFLAGLRGEVIETEARRTTSRGLASRAAERFACFRDETTGPSTLAALANERGLSRFQVLRAFKRRFGLAPHAYQLRVRLGLAQKSLREGVPPAHVAAELGFVDQSHFTRHFKQLVGVTPARYARGVTPTPTAARLSE